LKSWWVEARERESEEEMKMEIDGALGSGWSESSVFFRESQNDVDVDVRGKKEAETTRMRSLSLGESMCGGTGFGEWRSFVGSMTTRGGEATLKYNK